MHVLICSIIRNRKDFLFGWKDLILCLTDENPGITFDLSVYENDSTDGTKEYLRSITPELEAELNKVCITSVDEHKPYFGSVRDEERVKLLAAARNKTLDQIDLSIYDKIVFMEPDINFNPSGLSQLFYTDDDICSPYSLHPIEYQNHRWIYDSWATRLNIADDIFKGPRILEMPDVLPVQSTFNCFCVYRAKPFKEGARFSGINPITNNWDCDTTNICGEFIQRGYIKISLYNMPLIHLGN